MEYNWGIIKVEKDHMSASVTLKPLKDDDSFELSSEVILQSLRREGITAHADEDAIKELLTPGQFNRPVVVVRGKKPIRGKDGVLTFHVPVDRMRVKPVINPDGSVDFSNSLQLAVIQENDLFASYTPPTRGEYGFNVYSHILKPVAGKELSPLHGHGVISNDTHTQYHAEYSGHIMRFANTVNIEHLYRVYGDVDINSGDVYFDGDVEIMGDVGGGMSVEAGGNIFIHGHVGAASLKAGKSIIIEKGVQGRDLCILDAGKNVASSFIEHASVYALGNVYANSVLNSTIVARNHIFISGTILSSNVRGMLGITARNAGNQNEVHTILLSGVPSEEVTHAAELRSKMDEIDEQLRNMDATKHRFDNVEEITPAVREFQMKLTRSKILLSAERKRIENEFEPLMMLIETARKISEVKITGVAHTGITINIFGEKYEVDRSVMDIRLYMEGSRLRMDSGQSHKNASTSAVS